MIDVESIEVAVAAILPSIESHRRGAEQPFILGLSGLQGSGKSTWAAAIARHLTARHQLITRTISLDDLYLDHDDLAALRESHPENKLFHTRGQPGTHDEALAQRFFTQVLATGSANYLTGEFVAWPAYDKSLHQGQGGRVPKEHWERVSASERLDVLIFEGWCLGFQPLSETQVAEKWRQARALDLEHTQGPKPNTTNRGEEQADRPITTLGNHELDDLLLINDNLRRYCDTFTGPWRFNSFIHLSTDDLRRVYDWRLDQEAALKAQGRPGMSDGEVFGFVKGYMPAYELYLERLQEERLFEQDEALVGLKKHVKVILDGQRKVISIETL
ncbi:putative kinase mug58 [Tolypocladium ophioglossoides CBS 100239]|uniref:Putative kinase mug58 n=1 Tax=Tolypocladium ophioglossoides (strain CBS 100239) TaxID=1163406 RepID=A0A0L0N3Y8_TOLOC|nr:putative kinase mug58 [Tolypocladium ophioglossoides CBS 100239]